MAGSRIPDVVNAAVDALKADATLIGASLLNGSKVYTHVPENAVAPWLVVLGGQETPWAESQNDDDDRECQVDVVAVSKYRGTTQVDAIISRAIDVLTTHGTWTGVTGYAGCAFVINRAPVPSEIGGEMWFERSATVTVYLNGA